MPGGNDTTDISITSMTNVTIYLIFLPMLLRCGGNASCSKCYKRKRKFTRSEMVRDQRSEKVSTSIILLSNSPFTKIVIYSTKLNPKSNAKC